jgi:2-oxoisovalerate dehydrogenase E2 component (dihydrolipoyl transacylase)
MSVFVVRLPDVGEGVAEAELVAWHVAVGDLVTSDATVAEVLTDKATVEIYSPVNGRIIALHGEAGDVLAVGSDFIAIETDESPEPATPTVDTATDTDTDTAADTATDTVSITAESGPVTPVEPRSTGHGTGSAAPAVRERARNLGIDLGFSGTGPDGRITHGDLDDRLVDRVAPLERTVSPAAKSTSAEDSTQIPLIGLRRKIAAQMTIAHSRIPHITYVDEVDMTQIEHLRRTLAQEYPDQPRVTVLPFVIGALIQAIIDHPEVNATFDDEAGVLTTYRAVHVGIATQTASGLMVPVVRNAHTRDLWQQAAELERVTAAARSGSALRAELSGSTITITSLGALGGLVTTPIINHPEVAIVGINKMQIRPAWDGTSFVARTMMNLSSSFDHRIIDGAQAATFVQRIKTLLEEPSMLFMPRRPAPPSS